MLNDTKQRAACLRQLSCLSCWAGGVYSAGSNVYGQLGIGDRTIECRSELTTIRGELCGRRCVSVGTGTHVSFAVTSQGFLAIQPSALCTVH